MNHFRRISTQLSAVTLFLGVLLLNGSLTTQTPLCAEVSSVNGGLSLTPYYSDALDEGTMDFSFEIEVPESNPILLPYEGETENSPGFMFLN